MTRVIFWLAVIYISGFMSVMSYVYGDSRMIMDIFRIVFPLLTIWGLKKYSDIEAEYGPRPREFILGKIQVYNDVLESFTTTEQVVSIQCVEPFRKIFDFKKYPSKYEEYKIIIGNKEYSLSDITKFVIHNDQNIAVHYANIAALKRANGRGGQSISDAAARQRDLNTTRRLEMAFSDNTSYTLANLNQPVVNDMRGLLSLLS